MIASALFGALLGAAVFMVLPRSRTAAVGAVAGVLAGRPHRVGAATTPDTRELIEAIATWTEQVRDTISASGGLVQAMSVTASSSPTVIEPHVRRLSADLAYLDPASALGRFADAVDHQSCDLVVAALVAAQRHPVRDLSQLLGHLAECAREESRAHLRIWVGRARTRRAVKIIVAVVGSFLVGLFALSPGYMAPFVSTDGAIVGTLVVAMFAGAFWRLAHLARAEATPRLLGRIVAEPR